MMNETEEVRQIKVSPIELLIKACSLAYRRGAFNIREAEAISKAFTALKVPDSILTNQHNDNLNDYSNE